jgi:hypothetical protein
MRIVSPLVKKQYPENGFWHTRRMRLLRIAAAGALVLLLVVVLANVIVLTGGER